MLVTVKSRHPIEHTQPGREAKDGIVALRLLVGLTLHSLPRITNQKPR